MGLDSPVYTYLITCFSPVAHYEYVCKRAETSMNFCEYRVSTIRSRFYGVRIRIADKVWIIIKSINFIFNYRMRGAPTRLYSDVGSFHFLVSIVPICQLLNYVTMMQCKPLKISQRALSPVRENSLAAYEIKLATISNYMRPADLNEIVCDRTVDNEFHGVKQTKEGGQDF